MVQRRQPCWALMDFSRQPQKVANFLQKIDIYQATNIKPAKW
jgi:hypothetical protein